MFRTRRLSIGIIAACMAAGMAFSFTGCDGMDEKNVTEGNTIVITTAGDFKKGNLEVNDVIIKGNGEIELIKQSGIFKKSGIYTSGIIYTEPFQNLLLSCNADTPDGTSVKIEVQARVDGKWSEWLNWGTWGAFIKSGSNLSVEQDDLALMDEDVFIIKGDEKTADAIRYRATLDTDNDSSSPTVRSIAISIKNNLKPIETMYQESGKKQDYSKLDKVLNVPTYAQTIRYPKIAMDICSPTSVAMVMKYYGIDILPEECAWGVYDNSALLFGNWAYNCAFAGSYGFTAYTEYCSSLDDIKSEISEGRPVVASVRYKNNESVEGDLPVLHGAPIEKTAGHLVVVCGFTHENGNYYVVTNDPAAADDSGVNVKYLADEFENAWFKVAYVIRKDDTFTGIPRRIKAELVQTGKSRQDMDGTAYEYRLEAGGTTVDLSRDNARTIMYTIDGKTYKYLEPFSGRAFWFNKGEDGGRCSFIIITADRKVYMTDIS